MAKASQAREDKACEKAVLEYKAGVEAQWEERTPFLAHGLGLSLNDLNGVVRTAFRCAREDCEEQPRHHPKQALTKMWWEPDENLAQMQRTWENWWHKDFDRTSP